jgi:hypothetical protein
MHKIALFRLKTPLFQPKTQKVDTLWTLSRIERVAKPLPKLKSKACKVSMIRAVRSAERNGSARSIQGVGRCDSGTVRAFIDNSHFRRYCISQLQNPLKKHQITTQWRVRQCYVCFAPTI